MMSPLGGSVEDMDYANQSIVPMEKTGKYQFLAEPFHCDFSQRLFMGHLGNHLLNAADFHSTDRGFGMGWLLSVNRAWVLSRLAIEMDEMPPMYKRFNVETWVESAMRYFTNRSFRVSDDSGKVYGYGRSIWAMIDTETRQPCNLMDITFDDSTSPMWPNAIRVTVSVSTASRQVPMSSVCASARMVAWKWCAVRCTSSDAALANRETDGESTCQACRKVCARQTKG